MEINLLSTPLTKVLKPPLSNMVVLWSGRLSLIHRLCCLLLSTWATTIIVIGGGLKDLGGTFML